MSKRLLKSGIIVSGMTLVSRVLGLVRDVVIAHLIGAGAAADVFLFANRIPNFLRRLFAEGAFSQACYFACDGGIACRCGDLRDGVVYRLAK